MTIVPVKIATAEHHTWAGRGDDRRLARAPGLSVVQARASSRGQEQRQPRAHSRQFCFVAGYAVLATAGQVRRLGPAMGLEAPPGAPRQLRNEAGTGVSFRAITRPSSHGGGFSAPPDAA